ncbi:cupin domain-containing protein [Caballeronia sp. M23-90]
MPSCKTSAAIFHKNVEEIWYVLSGEGEIWRELGERKSVTPLCIGTALTIPQRTRFQFRNTGVQPLCILIVTMPLWPGPEEAVPVSGVW